MGCGSSSEQRDRLSIATDTAQGCDGTGEGVCTECGSAYDDGVATCHVCGQDTAASVPPQDRPRVLLESVCVFSVRCDNQYIQGTVLHISLSPQLPRLFFPYVAAF